MVWGSEEPGDQVCLGDLAVGGNMFLVCCVLPFSIVVVFIGIGGGFEVIIIWGARHKWMVQFLWGKLAPQDAM